MQSNGRPARAAGAAVLGLLLWGAVTSVAEAQYSATAEQRRACTPDVYRLCAGEIPNRAKITACLRNHRDRLSEACRAVFMQ